MVLNYWCLQSYRLDIHHSVYIGKKHSLDLVCFSSIVKSSMYTICVWPKLFINDVSTYREKRSVIFEVHPHRVHLECLNITIRPICNGIIRKACGFKLAVSLYRGCCQGHCGSLLFHSVWRVVVVVAREEDKLFFWLRDFGREWTHGMDKNLLHS